MRPAYQCPSEEIVRQLQSDSTRGLPSSEAARRLAQYGPNEIVERGRKSPWRILGAQFASTLMVILLLAALVSALSGDPSDYKNSVAILAIVVLNALLGFSQEYRAERAMAALQRLAAPIVRLVRDGEVFERSTRELVPGDVVLLEAGDAVPADGRLLTAIHLRIQESALTGESEPIEKQTDVLGGEERTLGDRTNMAFMGTTVVYGRGSMLVTQTGMATELGAIATMIQNVKPIHTPLQLRMSQLGRWLALAAGILVALIFGIGLLRGGDIRVLFLTAVSMAVAAIPEGLPAIVTIALALGSQRMLKRRALIRKLPAVETLGSVTVICSDKTGTLTENRMTVTMLDVAGHSLDLTTSLVGAEMVHEQEAPPAILSDKPGLALLLAGEALCNDAVLQPDPDFPDRLQSVGDPTESALLMAAARFGLFKPDLDRRLPRVAEVPFDSDRKRMATVHEVDESAGGPPPFLRAPLALLFGKSSAKRVVFVKGAVDGLLNISGRVWENDRAVALDDSWRRRIALANDELSRKGMRVLGVAVRLVEAGVPLAETECDLTFVGLVGMIDPPRPEVRAAVQTCREAGIRPVMITGDHPLTAAHIAAELGIAAADAPLLSGQDLQQLEPDELDRLVEHVSVYARVSPEHKLRIVQVLRRKGHVVAMTGDGVNDAPALKQADIGVAMGITGSDVTKEAADMVLQDDNFATIVAAVEEGRVIYDNIRKFVRYLLGTNSGELWTMLLAPFFGLPLPLLPLQILWMNLVTDGLPALALGLEPPERHTMRRPPHPPGESIFARGLGVQVLWVGLLMAAVALGLGVWAFNSSAHQDHFRSIVFTTLVLTQMANVLAIRSERDSLFRLGVRSNVALMLAVLVTTGLQLALLYVPFLQRTFGTVALTPFELTVSLLLSTVVFWAVELEKLIRRRLERARR